MKFLLKFTLLLLLLQSRVYAQSATFGPVADALQTSLYNTYGVPNHDYWWCANGLDVLTDGYVRTRSTTYSTRMKALLYGIRSFNSNTYINHFYDDMEWLGIACLRAYQATEDAEYLTIANTLWTDIKTGYSNNAINWNKSCTGCKNACSNGPAVILATRLYRITGVTADLDYAKNIFAFMKANLVDPVNGAVWDNIDLNTGVTNKDWIFSYNVGTYIGAGLELYKVTGDVTYLNDAVKTAEYAMNNRRPNGMFFADEVGAGDGGLFKGIFIRYFYLLAREGNIPADTRARYYEALRFNAQTLKDKGINPSTNLVNTDWSVPPSGTPDYSVQLSGVKLMETAATLDQAFFYKDINYGGSSWPLPVGSYNTAALVAKKIKDNDITSYTIPANTEVTFFKNDNFTGGQLVATTNNPWIGNPWNDSISSLIINPTGLTSKTGRYYLQNRLSGLYMEIAGAGAGDGTHAIQWSYSGALNQQFNFTHLTNGAYKIGVQHSGKVLSVSNGSITDGAKLVQSTDNGAMNQQFVLLDAGEGFYKLWNRKSTKQVEIKDYGTNAGDSVQQWTDVGQVNGLWELVPVPPAIPATLQVASPDSKIAVTLSLAGQQLSYQVAKESVDIVSATPMGINTSLGDFSTGVSITSYDTASVHETYQLPSGKSAVYHNNYRELTVRLNKGGKELRVIFRVYNDGFAYRYMLPGSGTVTVSSETGGFNIPAFDKSWGMAYVADYSTKFPERNWAAMSAVNTFAAPVLIKTTANNWLLLTEAANYGTYAVSKLKTGTASGAFMLQQTGAISSSLPLSTPWRTVITGTLPAIVESDIIDNLNPATAFSDLSWIRPGRASWDWGGEDGNLTASEAMAKSYVDLAAEMGWEYTTLDEGWEAAGYNMPAMVSYAASKGVGIMLWSHQNRFQNDEAQIRGILQQWKGWGIKGIKVDFWENDEQSMIQKYDKLIAIAGEQQLLVNLHGCTKPSGLRRKWPHLLTSEAVYGGEQYLFNSTVTPADHNINVGVVRTPIGATDYTPLDFATRTGVIRQLTTWAHQLALGVVFESGLQHMNDAPANYKYHIAKDLLKRLPAAWDETHCLEALPDKYTTIARRKGTDWYVASLTNEARTVSINLSFLQSGVNYYAAIYKDGTCNSEIVVEKRRVVKGEVLSIPLRTQGGVTVQISVLPLLTTDVTRYEAEATGNLFNNTVLTSDPDQKCSNNQYIGFIGNGNTLTFSNVTVPTAGTYVMTVYHMTGETRSTYFKVNAQAGETYSFSSTGSYNGNGLGMRSFLVSLNAGSNSIEFGNASGWAINIDRITLQKPPAGVATFYNDCNYTTPVAVLEAGDYTLAQLQAKGISNNSISSLKVDSGYQVILYDGDNFSGTTVTRTANTGCLVGEGNFNDKTTSLRILPLENAAAGEGLAQYTGEQPAAKLHPLVLYPNPVDNELFIRSAEDLTGAAIIINDVSGRQVLQGRLTTNKINVSRLGAGMYWLSLQKNGKIFNISFIK